MEFKTIPRTAQAALTPKRIQPKAPLTRESDIGMYEHKIKTKKNPA